MSQTPILKIEKSLFYIQKPAVFEYKKVDLSKFLADTNTVTTIIKKIKAFFALWDVPGVNHGDAQRLVRYNGFILFYGVSS
jgi:hypothetical protein